MIIAGARTGRWTRIDWGRGRSKGRSLGWSGKYEKEVGYIITMSSESRDDTGAHLPDSRGDEFSGPTGDQDLTHQRSTPTCSSPISIGLLFVCPLRVPSSIGELLLQMPSVVFLYS
jgi:hypothetical protein